MFRYPDKPSAQLDRVGLDDLPEIYLAQLKLDGWRCVVLRTATGLTFTSRHNKPIPVSCHVEGEIGDALAHLPVGTVLDGEWLARRPACRDESLWLFDIMQYGDTALWGEGTEWRYSLLRSLVPHEMVAPAAGTEYGEFYDAHEGRPDGEGIVLKKTNAKYIGSFRDSALNPGWLKAKWRAGEDGLTSLVRRSVCLEA
jgi:ATP-dependent DNA ligase